MNQNAIFELRQTSKGVGLFAKQAISYGEIVLKTKAVLTSVPSRFSIPVDKNVYAREGSEKDLDIYINHSCEPNLKIEIDGNDPTQMQYRALKNIPTGVELSWNYNSAEWSFPGFVCKCESSGCIGYVQGLQHLPAKDQLRVYPIGTQYIKNKIAQNLKTSIYMLCSSLKSYVKSLLFLRSDNQTSFKRDMRNIIASFDNSKISLRKTTSQGWGLFANSKISRNEVIAMFDGPIFSSESLPQEARDYAIQFSKNFYRDSIGFARFSNHSCAPNCGIKNKFFLVAMQDIDSDKEVVWDYAMTEDSSWKLHCKCGSSRCRKVISGYKDLPEEKRYEYSGFISDWLTAGH